MRNYSDRKPNYINMTLGRIETRVQEQGQFIMYKSQGYRDRTSDRKLGFA